MLCYVVMFYVDHPSAINRFVVLFTKCKSYFTRTLKVKRSTSFLTFILVTRQFWKCTAFQDYFREKSAFVLVTGTSCKYFGCLANHLTAVTHRCFLKSLALYLLYIYYWKTFLSRLFIGCKSSFILKTSCRPRRAESQFVVFLKILKVRHF